MLGSSLGSWRESGAGVGEGVGSGQGLTDRASCGGAGMGWCVWAERRVLW